MYCKAFAFGLALARALHVTGLTLQHCNTRVFFARAAFFPLPYPHGCYRYQSTATHTAPATPTARKGHKVDTMSKRTRNTTTTTAAPFDGLTSTTDNAAPLAVAMPKPVTLTHDAKALAAKAAKATTQGKGKAKPMTQAKARSKPQVQAQAPAVPALHGKAAPKPYAYPGDRDKVSAGTIINAMLALPMGATHAEMVDALVHNMPGNYAHNVKAAQAKARVHVLTVAAYAAKVDGPALAVTVDPAGHYKAPKAAHWQTLAGGGKCGGGRIVRVDDKGKALAV